MLMLMPMLMVVVVVVCRWCDISQVAEYGWLSHSYAAERCDGLTEHASGGGLGRTEAEDA